MTESDIKSSIRKRLSKLGCVVWQQATGHGKTESGSEISFGLCRGSSDIIGIRRRDGKFVAIEVKTPDGLKKHLSALDRATRKHESADRSPMTREERRALEQHMFCELVLSSGGLAGFATSEDDAERIVT